VRKLISFMLTSADGYHASPDEALDWHNVNNPEFGQFAHAQLREAATLLFGRVTYELMAGFWGTPAGEEADPEVARAMSRTPKIVISRTPLETAWAGTRVISTHVEEELAKLKQQPGKNILIQGSSTLVAELLPTGLVDEILILVNPVILGQGKSVYAGASRTALELLKTEQFKSGNVLHVYQPTGR
jgi:dihydrofolate reductase